MLSYHYKQRLGVDVSMHPCPLGLPAGGHSEEAARCYSPPTLLGGRPGRHDHAGTGWHEMNAAGIPKGYWVQRSAEILRGTLDGTFPQRFYMITPSSKEFNSDTRQLCNDLNLLLKDNNLIPLLCFMLVFQKFG